MANVSAGVAHLIWADLGNHQMMLADGDTLISLEYSSLVGSCPLTFTGNSEMVDAAGRVIDLNFSDGYITCDSGGN